MREERFEVLDSWRGIAAIIVALHHTYAISHIYPLPLVQNGWWFVDFFFVLSGFVISHAYFSRLRTDGALPSFMIQRFGRLYPLHIFMLALFFGRECLKVLAEQAGMQLGDAPFTMRTEPFAILTNVLMVHGFGFHTATAGSWNFPSWSIGVEFYTYLVFGGIVVLSKTPRFVFLALMVLSIAILATSPLYQGDAFQLGFFRCLLGFLLGHFVWTFTRTAFAQRMVSGWIRPYAAYFEVGTLVLVVVAVSHIRYEPLSFILPFIFGFAVLLFSIEAGPLSRGLKTPAFLYLGKLSYSIYMTHFFVIWFFAILFDKVWPRIFHFPAAMQRGPTLFFGTNPWMGDVITLAVLMTVIGVSVFTYRFVETPGRDYFRNLSKRINSGKMRAVATQPLPLP